MSDDPANTGLKPETSAPGRPVPGLLAWTPWLAAIGFALLAGFLGQAYFAARSQMAALRTEVALADIEKQSLRQQMEAERILAAHQTGGLGAEALSRLRIVQLIGATGEKTTGWAVVIWDAARQEGELAAFGLPTLPPDQRFRVCVIDPQYADPVCAATFAPELPGGQVRIRLAPARPIAKAARFVISAGGVTSEPRASDPVILSGD